MHLVWPPPGFRSPVAHLQQPASPRNAERRDQARRRVQVARL